MSRSKLFPGRRHDCITVGGRGAENESHLPAAPLDIYDFVLTMPWVDYPIPSSVLVEIRQTARYHARTFED
jgi:hypothetical protein